MPLESGSKRALLSAGNELGLCLCQFANLCGPELGCRNATWVHTVAPYSDSPSLPTVRPSPRRVSKRVLQCNQSVFSVFFAVHRSTIHLSCLLAPIPSSPNPCVSALGSIFLTFLIAAY